MKQINWDYTFHKIEPNKDLAQRLSAARKIPIEDVIRVLSANILTPSTLSLLCGYPSPQNVIKMIASGYLSVCYPFSIIKRAKNKTRFKGFMFVCLDENCVGLIERRLG